MDPTFHRQVQVALKAFQITRILYLGIPLKTSFKGVCRTEFYPIRCDRGVLKVLGVHVLIVTDVTGAEGKWVQDAQINGIPVVVIRRYKGG